MKGARKRSLRPKRVATFPSSSRRSNQPLGLKTLGGEPRGLRRSAEGQSFGVSSGAGAGAGPGWGAGADAGAVATASGGEASDVPEGGSGNGANGSPAGAGVPGGASPPDPRP